MSFTIGELARRAGVGVETVRFYERRGLLEDPRHNGSGHRHYPEETVARLQFIRRGQRLGFTLKEVEELLALRLDPSASRADVQSRALEKVAEVEKRIRHLKQIRKTLNCLIEKCGGKGPISECPILEALEKGEVVDGISSRQVDD